MKEEKEVLWLVKLFKATKLSNSKQGGSKNEFEEYANNSIRDINFNKWFKEMVNMEIVNFLEYRENSKGSPTKIYLLNKRKLVKYLRGFNFYQEFRSIILDLIYGDI